ncbi:MAG TPA: hypothetical protein VGR29_06600, partial [Thermomicrobiales bacterium]|nr:hypothetical protein [Thermomicrobiales bacterium]
SYPLRHGRSALMGPLEDATLDVRPVLPDAVALDVVLSQRFVSRELLERGSWFTQAAAPTC